MANYQESTATATSWIRCRSVSIENPIGGTPSASFVEHKVVQLGGHTVEQFVGILPSTFNPTASIPLRDPETGGLTGDSVTQAHLYQILYSLYMQAALDRDAGQS